MMLEDAMRLTEILLGLAFVQQNLEYIFGEAKEPRVFVPRLLASALLVAGVLAPYMCLALVTITLIQLYRYQGPYNGGSDRMGMLVLFCLTAAQFAPTTYWKEIAFGYLAIQLTLSYFISGWVKIVNPEWRSGLALRDVFQFSAYPVSDTIRGWASHPQLLLMMSWSVIGFELLFPLALLSQATLVAMLVVTATFHLANACLFGLNRFFWIWLTAYPSIIWFQDRIF